MVHKPRTRKQTIATVRSWSRPLGVVLVGVALLVACGTSSVGRATTGAHSPASADDGDRLTGAADRCPGAPEDEDGFRDLDGCPDADDDGDGVPDATDECRCVAEDRDGFEDGDGCPDLDDDRDTLVDACDVCPHEPEVYNGCSDEDGCPDTTYVCVEQSQLVILEHFFFRTRDTRLLPAAEPLLEAIAATMISNPQIDLVRIVGHTDGQEARGDTPAAARLALARATAVRDALVARGVPAARLVVEERGPREPLVEEHTAADRDRNRRVDFEVARMDGHDLLPSVASAAPNDTPSIGCANRCAVVHPACDTPPPPPRDVCADR